jgi:SNF2 family DNA or RNA helicase
MSFAMPGVLGTRVRFARQFDKASDPLARQRLAARVRPFLLRRTKAQVAPELPDRIEEDLLCEMEPAQLNCYRAELKKAQQQLLLLKTSRDFDRERFNVLTSLLRLRQICCHPSLIDATAKDIPSAKLEALMDLVEPLMEEGHKVLVFSQFVGLIQLLQPLLAERKWKHFVLTGATEDRGELVASFQKTRGAAVFLISLKAGGFGLNLTASSYVILFDPWWNPAVENQAIDRTHRIGQKNKVIAYRLLTRDTVEEKIRILQHQKTHLVTNVLGDEGFASNLGLDDLQFILTHNIDDDEPVRK